MAASDLRSMAYLVSSGCCAWLQPSSSEVAAQDGCHADEMHCLLAAFRQESKEKNKRKAEQAKKRKAEEAERQHAHEGPDYPAADAAPTEPASSEYSKPFHM